MAISPINDIASAVSAFGDMYGLKLRILQDPSSMTYIIRSDTGNEVRITDQLIVNQRSMREVREVIKIALMQMIDKEGKTRRSPADYSKLDAAYKKVLSRYSGTSETFTGTMSQTFSYRIPYDAPVNAMQEGWNQYANAMNVSNQVAVKPKKQTNVMPETKKRAITLEE